MRTIIRYLLLTATRDRLFLALFACIAFSALIASAIGGTAMLEPQAMTLTLTAAASRLVIAVGLVVFVCFHLRAAFQSKEIDLLLSRPLPRPAVVLAYWLGFAVVASLVALPAIISVYLIGPLNQAGFWYWAASLLLEGWLVVAVALFAGFTLRSAVASVLLSLGFYVLSRMIGFFIATAQGTLGFTDPDLTRAVRFIIDAVSVAAPRLDFFAKTEWLVYGLKTSDEWQWFAMQAAAFMPLLIVATIIDFKRRRF